MSFKTGEVLGDAVDRLTTSAGAVLIGGIALFGILRTAAGQDITRGVLEWVLDQLETAGFRDDLGPQQLEALESVEAELEAHIAELPLALGLSPGLAAGLWLLAYVLGLVVVVVALDTFGNARDTLSGLETEGVGWKTLNLFFGGIVFGILVFVGLLLFVLPGLVFIVLLVFFPAAVVLDDENFFGAFGSSVAVARSNIGGAIAVVLLAIVVGIAVTVAAWIVGGFLPPAGDAIAGDLLSAIGVAFGLALIARAYADSAVGEPDDEDGPVDEDGSAGEPAEEGAPVDESADDDGPVDESADDDGQVDEDGPADEAESEEGDGDETDQQAGEAGDGDEADAGDEVTPPGEDDGDASADRT